MPEESGCISSLFAGPARILTISRARLPKRAAATVRHDRNGRRQPAAAPDGLGFDILLDGRDIVLNRCLTNPAGARANCVASISEKIAVSTDLLPLAIFFFLTIVAVLLSPDIGGGIPQLRKFFVFGIILLLYNTIDSLDQVRALVFAWTGAATLSALLGFLQFLNRYRQAVQMHAVIYDYLLDGRIRRIRKSLDDVRR